MKDILTQLDEVLEERKAQNPQESYVASLYAKGTEKILKKIAEEALEVAMAAKDNDHSPNNENTQHLVYEVADLWFHTLILLHHQGQDAQGVLAELQRRFGLSGLIEKAQRNT